MRAWTKSACVVLAWIILSCIPVAVGMNGTAHPAQANTRTASSTEITLTSMLSVAAAPVTATSHITRYVVQPGDTLSGIAARFGVRGGWPALYAANRQTLGPNPNVIHPGTVLVLPGRTAPVRYTVAAGDTLSGIAADFAVRGGWAALYAANRQTLGPDPNVIHSGIVLTIPRPAAPSAATPGRALRRQHPPTPPPSPSAGPRHHPRPVPARAPAATGMPQWLRTVLLAVGLLILLAFLAEPVRVVRRRRRQAAAEQAAARQAAVEPNTVEPNTVEPNTVEPVAVEQAAVGQAAVGQAAVRQAAVEQARHRQATVRALRPGQVGSGPGPGCWRASACQAHIILADYHRVIVTRSKPDDTVYVLRPPGEDPKKILRVARLVLPEGPYGELAKQLGMPAIGPVG